MPYKRRKDQTHPGKEQAMTYIHHNGTPTSMEAAESMRPHVPTIEQQVAEHIAKCGTDGATTDEIEVALGILHQCASARINRLHRSTRIVDMGERRKTRSGRNAVVWFSAENGK
jgi:hypothetical protein